MSDNFPPGSAPEPPSGGTPSTPPQGGSAPQTPSTPPTPPTPPAAAQQPTPPPPPPAASAQGAGQPSPVGAPGGSPTGVGAAVNWAISKFGQNWTVLVGFALLIAITQGISASLASSDSESGVLTFFEFALSLVLAIAAIVLAISLVRASLKISRGEKAEWSDLWNPTHFWQYIGVAVVIGLLYFLVAVVGIGGLGLSFGVGGFFAGALGIVLVLGAIVVGVLLWWLLQFSQWSVINEGRGIGAALSESVNLVKANKTESVLTLLVLLLLQFLGVITCGIGTLVTLPIGMLFMAHMYRQFRGETSDIVA